MTELRRRGRQKAPPMTDAELEAFRALLALVEKYHALKWQGCGELRPSTISLSHQQFAELKVGTFRPQRRCATVRKLALEACQIALAAPERTLAEQLWAAVRAVGADVLRVAHRTASEYHADLERLSAPQPRPGVHVAPFTSLAGRPVLLAIGPHGGLGFMAEVTSASGTGEQILEDGRVERFDAGAVFSSGEALGHYQHRMLPAGVQLAPWRPWEDPRGVSYIAIDAQHRLVARMDVPPGGDRATARQDLEAVLELVSLAQSPSQGAAAGGSSGYHDPYDDGYEDPDTCGEDWKRDSS